MLLRPMSMASNWSSVRLGSISPLIKHLNKRRVETIQSLAEKKSQKRAKELASGTINKLYRDHKIQPGLGCLMWIFIFPVLIGFHNAIDTGYALHGAEFLWIKDMARPDNFYPLVEPLVEIDFAKYFFNKEALAGQPRFDLTYRIASIHLLPILLYALPWLETIILRFMGVKTPFRLFSTLISFVFFMLLFYNFPAGVHLGFLAFRLVWACDQIRLFRYLQRSQQALAAKGAKTTGQLA